MKFGMMTPLVTPLHADGSLNEQALATLVEDQIEHGVHSLLVLGGTAEVTALTPEIRKRSVEIVVEATNKRVPVVAGVIELGIYDAIRSAKVCKEAGADALLVCTPYGGATSPQGCVDYFAAIDAAMDMPIIIYNFPGRTGYNCSPDVVGRLLDKIPNIVGIKECAEKFDQTMQLISRFGDRMQVLSGNEFQAPWEMLMGAKGAILASANPLPAEWVKIYDLALERKADEMSQMFMKLYPLVKVMFNEQHPGPMKYVMSKKGFDVGDPLPPICPVSQKARDEIDAMLKQFNVI